jgi:hypothetical protein
MTSARHAASAVALSLSLLAASAHAEPTAEDLASARELFKEGRTLREQGDLPKALEKLRAAHALGQTPITGLELARTYVLVGKLVDAREVSLGVARLPVASDETGRSDAARAEAVKLATSLEPRLAKLIVTVKGMPAMSAVSVSVDGEAIPVAAIGEPRSADPGVHVAVLTLAGGGEVRTEIEVKEGESRALVLDAATAINPSPPAPPPPPTPARPEPPPSSHPDPILVTGATAGGLGLLIGASFGIATFVTKGSLETDCPGGRCGPAHYAELTTAQNQATGATIGFGIAGAGAAAVILDLIFAPKKSATKAAIVPELGAGWVGAHGSF